MVAVKIVGSVLIIISSWLIGHYYANRDNFRIQSLEEFKKALIILKSQIQYSMTTLPDAMMIISKRTGKGFSGFFKYVSDRLNEKKGEGISDIWAEALDCSLKRTYLVDEDIDYFKALGSSLGYLDMKLQINSIEIAVEYINSKIEFLNSVGQKNKKMYQSLGILGGILIAVVFL